MGTSIKLGASTDRRHRKGANKIPLFSFILIFTLAAFTIFTAAALALNVNDIANALQGIFQPTQNQATTGQISPLQYLQNLFSPQQSTITCRCRSPNSQTDNYFYCSASVPNNYCMTNYVCSSSGTWTWPNDPCVPASNTNACRLMGQSCTYPTDCCNPLVCGSSGTCQSSSGATGNPCYNIADNIQVGGANPCNDPYRCCGGQCTYTGHNVPCTGTNTGTNCRAPGQYCNSLTPCCAGLTCSASICISGSGTGCTVDSQCPAGQQCRSGKCQTTTSTGQITCTCDTPGLKEPYNHFTCSAAVPNNYCSTGYVCNSNQVWTWPNDPCVPASSSNCGGSGQPCCVISGQTACNQGLTCSNNVCTTGTTSGTITCTCLHPNQNSPLNDYTCNSATQSNYCPNGPGNCYCSTGQVCASSSSWAYPNYPCQISTSGTGCTSDAQCPNGQFCKNGQCQTSTSTGQTCTSQGGQCKTGCGGDQNLGQLDCPSIVVPGIGTGATTCCKTVSAYPQCSSQGGTCKLSCGGDQNLGKSDCPLLATGIGNAQSYCCKAAATGGQPTSQTCAQLCPIKVPGFQGKCASSCTVGSYKGISVSGASDCTSDQTCCCLGTQNLPCLPDKSSCAKDPTTGISTGIACCSGGCSYGISTCCTPLGNSCSADSQCCDGGSCVGGKCAKPNGGVCTSDAECVSGHCDRPGNVGKGVCSTPGASAAGTCSEKCRQASKFTVGCLPICPAIPGINTKDVGEATDCNWPTGHCCCRDPIGGLMVAPSTYKSTLETPANSALWIVVNAPGSNALASPIVLGSDPQQVQYSVQADGQVKIITMVFDPEFQVYVTTQNVVAGVTPPSTS